MVHRPHFNKLQILPDTESTKSKNTNDLSERDPKKLEAARLFENQFVRQMIREMRKTVPQNENGQGLIPESMGSKIFKDQLDDKYADQWVDHGGIGLADIIYDQLEAKEVRDKMGLSKKNNIFLNQKIPQSANQAPKPNDNSPGPFDVISKSQKDLFLLKASGDSLHIKSKEPLPEEVGLRSPLSGVVLHSADLGEGKRLLKVRHDLGPGQKMSLTSQIVHTGSNTVQVGDKISPGQIVAKLPRANSEEERAYVVFGLRKEQQVE